MSSLDIELPARLDMKSDVYLVDPDENTNANAITGVAKRRFKRDYDVDSCRATKIFEYNNQAFVFVCENPHRDYLDGYAIKVVRESPDAVEDYQCGTEKVQKAAMNELVQKTMDDAFMEENPEEVRDRIERFVGMIS